MWFEQHVSNTAVEVSRPNDGAFSAFGFRFSSYFAFMSQASEDCFLMLISGQFQVLRAWCGRN